MQIKFTQDYTTKENKPRTYKKDQVVDYPDTEAGKASAQHFLNRGVAEEVGDEPKDKSAPKSKDKPESLVPGPASKGGGKTEAL